LDLVQLFLDRSVTRVRRDREGKRNPIHAAVRYGRSKMIAPLVEALKKEAGDDEDRQKWWTDTHFDGAMPLARATMLGYPDVVRELLQAGAPVDAAEGERDAPFANAAYRGYIECVKLLLDGKVNVESVNSQGTALGAACETGHIEIAKLLLDAGADPDKMEGCCPPLTHAVISNKLELVKLMVERGATLNTTSASAKPLNQAAGNDQKEIAEYLLEAGSKLDIANKWGWNPLHSATDNPEILRMFLKAGADINKESTDGSALYLASYHGHLEGVKVLVEMGADLETKLTSPDFSDTGYTPLLAAADRGRDEVMRYLLDNGADPNAKGGDGMAAIHHLTTADAEDRLAILLEYDLDLQIKDNDGDTALHYIRESTPVSITRRLVNRGAKVDAKNDEETTPLWAAVKEGNLEVATYLVSKKADVNTNYISNGTYSSVLSMPCRYGELDMVQMLVRAGADPNWYSEERFVGSIIQTACFRNDKTDEDKERKSSIIHYLVDEVKVDLKATGGQLGSVLNPAGLKATPDIIAYLIKNGAPVDSPDPMGRLPIHCAAFRSVDHMQPLLEAGADPMARDKMGRTALHVAVASGRVELVEKVLSLTPAGVDVPDADGWSPLLWACRRCNDWGVDDENLGAVMKFLVDHGADLWKTVTVLDRTWSPLKLARYHGHAEEALKVLTPDPPRRTNPLTGAEDRWEDKEHVERKAKSMEVVCNACLMVSFPFSFLLLVFCPTTHMGHPT